MKRWLVLAVWAISFTATALERVVDFHSAIRVQADGVLEVTERIAVETDGRQIAPGIVRDFPIKAPFGIRKVLRNGSPEPWTTERLWSGVRVRISRPESLPQPGTHVYEISYRTAGQIGHLADHDELYWNVNGTGWTLVLDHVSAEVHLPKPVPARELRAEAYTGAQGARGRDYRDMLRDGAVGFTSTTPFRPGEGMTIVVGFPKGVVAEPGLLRRAGWLFSQHIGVAAALAGLALMLAFASAPFLRNRARAARAPRPPA